MSTPDVDGVASLVGAAFLAAGGIAMLLLARRSAAGTLAPNPIAGVRTRRTMTSHAAWDAAQAAAAGATAVAGWGAIAFAVLAVILAFLPIGEIVNLLIMLSVVAGAVWLVVWLVVGTSRGDRAAAAAD